MEVGLEVNPLANPKGVKLVCHLCQKPARIQCLDCRVTYYCSVQDQTADWNSIHSQVCQLLASLKAPVTHSNSDVERKQIRKQQQDTRVFTIVWVTVLKDHITELALTEGRKHLHNGEYRLAFPPSLLALKLLVETYSSTHLQLTPALLLLAQSSLGQNQLRNAEQYLSQAHWTILQNPSTSHSLHSQLHHNLGLLATAREDYAIARKHFAEDIYQSSVAYDTQSIMTVSGLFQLGNVFLKEDKPDVAFSFFEEVVKIWMVYLDGIIQEMMVAVQTPMSTFSLPGGRHPLEKVTTMNIAKSVEARQQLQTLFSLDFNSSLFLYKTCFTIALLYIVMKEYPQAIVYIGEALRIKHESTATINELNPLPANTQLEEMEALISTLKNETDKIAV